MTIIGCNKNHLYGKFIILMIFAGLIMLFASIIVNPRGNNLSVGNNNLIMPVGAIILLLFLSSTIFIQLYYIPVGVDIYEQTNELEIKHLFSKSEFYSISDIEVYYATKIYTRGDKYEGLLVHLNSGRKLLISNFNLLDYLPVKAFLDEAGIKNNGNEKFGFISYYIPHLKKSSPGS